MTSPNTQQLIEWLNSWEPVLNDEGKDKDGWRFALPERGVPEAIRQSLIAAEQHLGQLRLEREQNFLINGLYAATKTEIDTLQAAAAQMAEALAANIEMAQQWADGKSSSHPVHETPQWGRDALAVYRAAAGKP